MTVKVNNILNSLLHALLITTLVCCFTQTTSTIVFAQPGLVVVIDSDTTWTKADSPHELTGPLFVSQGATLTIEAGATVDLNDYNVLVNGTLRAIGTSSQKIQLISTGKAGSETIEFTQHSNGWNEETGSGSTLENVVTNHVHIDSSAPVKVYKSEIYSIYVSSSSIITDNTIKVLKVSGGSPIIQNNDIYVIDIDSGTPEILDNTIERIENGDHCSSSPVISGNLITSIGHYGPKTNGGVSFRVFQAKSITITNNTIRHGIFVVANSAVIANNTVTGYTFSGYEWFIVEARPINITSPGIILEGKGNVSGNIVTGCSLGIKGGTLIEGNLLTNNTDGIIVTQNDAIVRNNNIQANSTGIEALTGGKVTIENNLIKDCDKYGVNVITSEATILNNTITNVDQVAIRLLECGSAKINYNNIENYAQYSIYLDGTSSTIDATNNWWGTTDTQAIDATIYDFKHDFYLGKVNIEPILTEPNPNAQPKYIIPEFPTWTILPLAAVIILVAIIFKKKIP
ncbi:MAG: right-handed parallel beta-helix repeat-containing protein [Candidatus Bathyarchaeota archaeon]|nr:right-handed parallel beta-helix repeat-containing protein [Candidatus Bathyarchaeum tardum]WGM89469.1 MAG: right-handed parallel beta-helix repeat-containing protein [Candidatus Bathyarchaeum tardum]